MKEKGERGEGRGGRIKNGYRELQAACGFAKKISRKIQRTNYPNP
jgi:hypothetical protein